MKQFIFILLFLFFVPPAKTNEIATDYFIGKVFLINGDTLIAKIHLSYYEGDFITKLYTDNFGHYLDSKDKVRGLNPNKINGFEIIVDSTLYTFISKLTNKGSDKKRFCHLLNSKNNAVLLYEYFNSGAVVPMALFGGLGAAIAESGGLSDRLYLIEYNNGVTYHPQRKGFRSDRLAFILSDNTEIAKKIEDGIYKYVDMPLIIAEYNNWYSTK